MHMYKSAFDGGYFDTLRTILPQIDKLRQENSDNSTNIYKLCNYNISKMGKMKIF